MTVTPQTNATLAEIASELKARDNFVICGHVSPDGDCIGSQLALAYALRAIGKNVACVLVKDEPIDFNLRFLPGAEDLVFAGAYVGVCDTFVAVDVPNRERIGVDAAALLDAAGFSITIDHHAVPERMTDLDYTDPDAASTTMLIWEVAQLLCDEPPYACAQCAYTGLVTDTGCFQYQNTDVAALESAASMIAAGVVPSEITREVMQNASIPSLKLQARVIDRMAFSENKAAVVSYVTVSDFEELGAAKSDAEPLVNVLRSVRGVRVAAMLREQDEEIRCSLRAKDDTDVAQVARMFGGGGHKAAAGCTLEMPLDDAIRAVGEAIDSLVEEGAER